MNLKINGADIKFTEILNKETSAVDKYFYRHIIGSSQIDFTLSKEKDSLYIAFTYRKNDYERCIYLNLMGSDLSQEVINNSLDKFNRLIGRDDEGVIRLSYDAWRYIGDDGIKEIERLCRKNFLKFNSQYSKLYDRSGFLIKEQDYYSRNVEIYPNSFFIADAIKLTPEEKKELDNIITGYEEKTATSIFGSKKWTYQEFEKHFGKNKGFKEYQRFCNYLKKFQKS